MVSEECSGEKREEDERRVYFWGCVKESDVRESYGSCDM